MELKFLLTILLAVSGHWGAAERAAEALSSEQHWDVRANKLIEQQIPEDARPPIAAVAHFTRVLAEQHVTLTWSF